MTITNIPLFLILLAAFVGGIAFIRHLNRA